MEKRSLHNESFLLQQLSGGSQQAFAEVYNTHHAAVLSVALRLVKAKPLAEEICNDVFTALWQNRQCLPTIQSLQAYLLVAARNRAINALKNRHRSQSSLEELRHLSPTSSLDAEAHLLQKEYVDFIRRQVAALPARAREVFGLCRGEGCSYEEASARLGISRNAVKGHMVSSMKKLKTVVQKDLGISFFLTLLFGSL